MIELIPDFLTSTAWSVVGFLAGYFVGHLEREVHQIKETVVDGTEESDTDEAHRRSTRRWNGTQVLGVIVVVLALLTVAQLSVSSTLVERKIECQNQVNRALRADALTRGQEADREWQAFLALVRDLTDARTPLERDKALREFRDRAEERDRQRRDSPPTAYIADEC